MHVRMMVPTLCTLLHIMGTLHALNYWQNWALISMHVTIMVPALCALLQEMGTAGDRLHA